MTFDQYMAANPRAVEREERESHFERLHANSLRCGE